MASEHTLKRKVTVKLTYTGASPQKPGPRSVASSSSTTPRPRATIKSSPSTPQSRPLPAPRVPLHHAASFDGRHSPTPPVRIKAKVTSLAKSTELLSPRSATSPPPAFYPITTATPAANPHRYAQSHHYQPLLDPALPATTVSPPASALSFSSRSSLSTESAVSKANGDDERLRSTINNLLRYNEMNQDPTSDTEINNSDNQTRKVKAEAKSNRKIADLEITNRSLLAINASLETAKHRQEKEIRELRRKLRESRLILPPRAYRAFKDNSDHEEEEDEQDDIEGAADGDEVYQRIKVILDALLQTAKTALESKPEDFVDVGRGGTKVLSAEEVRTWRRDSSVEQPSSIGIDPSNVAVPDSDNDSEDEVETTLTRSPSPPPITNSH